MQTLMSLPTNGMPVEQVVLNGQEIEGWVLKKRCSLVQRFTVSSIFNMAASKGFFRGRTMELTLFFDVHSRTVTNLNVSSEETPGKSKVLEDKIILLQRYPDPK